VINLPINYIEIDSDYVSLPQQKVVKGKRRDYFYLANKILHSNDFNGEDISEFKDEVSLIKYLIYKKKDRLIFYMINMTVYKKLGGHREEYEDNKRLFCKELKKVIKRDNLCKGFIYKILINMEEINEIIEISQVIIDSIQKSNISESKARDIMTSISKMRSFSEKQSKEYSKLLLTYSESFEGQISDIVDEEDLIDIDSKTKLREYIKRAIDELDSNWGTPLVDTRPAIKWSSSGVEEEKSKYISGMRKKSIDTGVVNTLRYSMRNMYLTIAEFNDLAEEYYQREIIDEWILYEITKIINNLFSENFSEVAFLLPALFEKICKLYSDISPVDIGDDRIIIRSKNMSKHLENLKDKNIIGKKREEYYKMTFLRFDNYRNNMYHGNIDIYSVDNYGGIPPLVIKGLTCLIDLLEQIVESGEKKGESSTSLYRHQI
jgi:hypothetical protein